MTIARDWILAHRTANGGWTQKRLAAIGVRWPPQRGWLELVRGKEIAPEQQQRFEAEAGGSGSYLDHIRE